MIKYFKTYIEAANVAKTIPDFKPSQFLTDSEVANGRGNVKVNQYKKGYAIQLGDFGAFYPEINNQNWQDEHVHN